MTGLTLFTPVRRRWEPVLRTGFWLGKYVPLAQKHILQFDFIHFVRWTIVHELPHVDPAKRQKLNYGYLFFESNFDGPWQHYIDAFAYVIPKDIRFVWGRGHPLPLPAAGRAAEGVDRAQQHGGRPLLLRLSAREHADVQGRAGGARATSRSCCADAERQSPEEFKAAYERFLADHQAHL